MRPGRSAALAAGSLALARPADAHIVASRLGDFYVGALHPLTGIEDVLLWLALGVLAGSQGAARLRLLVVLFPAGLLLGLLAGFGLGRDITSPLVNAGLMVALGGLLAAGPRLPAWLVGGLAMAVAVLRGIANATGAGSRTDLVLFAAGFVLAGYAMITLAMGATAAFCRARSVWRPIALRAVGSWIAAIGVMFGGYALAVR